MVASGQWLSLSPITLNLELEDRGEGKKSGVEKRTKHKKGGY